MSFTGGGKQATKKATETKATTPTYQQYAGRIVEGIHPQMQQAYEQGMGRYLQGYTPQQQQTWQESWNAMNQYGTQGPAAQVAQQYIQPYLGAGYMQSLEPYYAAQRQELQGAVPLEQQAFWQDMKRQLGGLWGTSGRGLEQTAEAYGNLRATQQQRFAELEAQKAAAAQQGIAWTGATAPQYAQMVNPAAWGQERMSWLSMPEQYRQMQLGSITPWSEMLMGLAGMGYQYPESIEEAAKTAGTQKEIGSSGGISCCFIFMEGNMLMPYVRKFRDTFYPKTGTISKGYRAMASWLVPAMRKSVIVRKLVEISMLRPLALLAKLYYEGSPYYRLLKPFEWFWCKGVWGTLGLFSLPQYTWEKFYATK